MTGLDVTAVGYGVFVGGATLTAALVLRAGLGYRRRPGAGAFAVLTVCAMLWSGTELLSLAVDDRGTLLFAQQVSYVVIALVPVVWVVLITRYTKWGPRIGPRTLAILLVVPAATGVLAVTNQHHHLLWTVDEVATVAGVTTLSVSLGPWFPVHAAYSYSLLGLGACVLLWWAVRSRVVAPVQLGMIAAALGVTVVANVVQVLGMSPAGVDVTPVGMVMTCVLLLSGLYRYRLFTVTPVARDRIVEDLDVAVTVLDGDDRVVDANPAAKRTLTGDDPFGDHVAEVFDDEVAARCLDEAGDTALVCLDSEDEQRHFRLRVSRLSDSPVTGSVLLFHDVTSEQRRREELATKTDALERKTTELQRQNERLDRFASLVSHDLRNPLNVAVGWTELLGDTDADSEAIDRIAGAHERMNDLIDDTLQLARESTPPEKTTLSLSAVAHEAVQSIDAAVELVVDTERTVVADRDRLLRALENLVRNSVEHGANGDGEVRITVGDLPAADGGSAVSPGKSSGVGAGRGSVDDADGPGVERTPTGGFYVSDDGVGFPEPGRERLFEYGQSGDGGTGLGLAIVRDVADAHGWDVVATDAPGGGARVEVRGVEIGEGVDRRRLRQ